MVLDSTETLGAMAVITMIILTPDNQLGLHQLVFFFFFFFFFASKRYQLLCSILTEGGKKISNLLNLAKILPSNENEVMCCFQPHFTLFSFSS